MSSFRARWEARKPHFLASLRPASYREAAWWTVSDPDALSPGLPDTESQLSLRLAEAFDSWGSDKSRSHDYQLPYAVLLAKCPEGPILEIGIGTNNVDVPSNMGAAGTPGASLRAWRAMGLFTEVHGADIDQRILFSEPGITTHFVDQLDRESLEGLRDALELRCPGGFSLVIDDGLHTAEANIATFDVLFDVVQPGGFYAIEDIHPSELGPILQHIAGSGHSKWGLWSNPTKSADNLLIAVCKPS